MKIQEAIEKAIEGGWKLDNTFYPTKIILCSSELIRIEFDKNAILDFNISQLVLDPEFMKALGKGLGWGKTCLCHGIDYKNTDAKETMETFRYKMHEMIDHLYSGGSAESFLEGL